MHLILAAIADLLVALAHAIAAVQFALATAYVLGWYRPPLRGRHGPTLRGWLIATAPLLLGWIVVICV